MVVMMMMVEMMMVMMRRKVMKMMVVDQWVESAVLQPDVGASGGAVHITYSAVVGSG